MTDQSKPAPKPAPNKTGTATNSPKQPTPPKPASNPPAHSIRSVPKPPKK